MQNSRADPSEHCEGDTEIEGLFIPKSQVKETRKTCIPWMLPCAMRQPPQNR